jgi:hypothetical protein
MSTPQPTQLTFVVQGAIARGGGFTTRQVCAAIRRWFPESEIVLSTWCGQDVDGIEADQVVLSDDPGPLPSSHNTNRQLLSSCEGVRRASNDLVMKVRSDVLFVSDSVLAFWDRWTHHAKGLRIVGHRVLVPSTFTRRPSLLAPLPFHPSDWCMLGTRDDLLALLDIPPLRPEESLIPIPRTAIARCQTLYGGLHAAIAPEQHIWTAALRAREPDFRFRHSWDLTPETFARSELFIANNVVVLDTYDQFGVVCLKYPLDADRSDFTLYHHSDWLELYEAHCRHSPQPSRRSPAEILGDVTDLPSWSPDDPRIRELRSCGHRWEAQLAESAVHGRRLSRDVTWGGRERPLMDARCADLAHGRLRDGLAGAAHAPLHVLVWRTAEEAGRARAIAGAISACGHRAVIAGPETSLDPPAWEPRPLPTWRFDAMVAASVRSAAAAAPDVRAYDPRIPVVIIVAEGELSLASSNPHLAVLADVLLCSSVSDQETLGAFLPGTPVGVLPSGEPSAWPDELAEVFDHLFTAPMQRTAA